MSRILHPWERAAVHAAEMLARASRPREAAVLLAMVDRGDVPESDDYLREAFRLIDGPSLEEVYRQQDALFYRDGRRVCLPADPCPHALRRWDDSEDPARERPCLLQQGHPPACQFADVPLRRQREATLEFRADVERACAALSVRH